MGDRKIKTWYCFLWLKGLLGNVMRGWRRWWLVVSFYCLRCTQIENHFAKWIVNLIINLMQQILFKVKPSPSLTWAWPSSAPASFSISYFVIYMIPTLQLCTEGRDLSEIAAGWTLSWAVKNLFLNQKKYYQKSEQNWPSKPNLQNLIHFDRYLGTRCIVFKTDFCIETVSPSRSFWIPWTL